MNLKRAINLEDLRRMARRHAPRIVFDYVAGGAEDETGIARNRRAFDRLLLHPRYLVDVSERSQSVEIFGRQYASPFGIAPTGLAGFVRPGADLALAEAAAEANIPFVLSGAGTASIEAVARVAPQHAWVQIYASRSPQITEDMIRRARDAGVEVLMLTVDVPVLPKRERDIRNGLVNPVQPNFVRIFEMFLHPRWLLGLLRHGAPRFETWVPYAPPNSSYKALALFLGTQMPSPQSWRDLARYRALWPGKLVVKGIMTPADALGVAEQGADGILVSNHGGRQLDCAPAPIDVLSTIHAAVGDKLPVMLDSGVWRGSDILKAWALGARFLFVGRAMLYGAAAGGKAGVARAIEILRGEIDLGLGQIGCRSLAELTADFVSRDDSPR